MAETEPDREAEPENPSVVHARKLGSHVRGLLAAAARLQGEDDDAAIEIRAVVKDIAEFATVEGQGDYVSRTPRSVRVTEGKAIGQKIPPPYPARIY